MIHNVTTKTITITYKLPRCKAFGLDFPEPINLRPGLSHTLRITFRPVRMEACEDTISFQCTGGGFKIPVVAFAREVKLQLPAQLDFGLSAVHRVRAVPTLRCTSTYSCVQEQAAHIMQHYLVNGIVTRTLHHRCDQQPR